MTLTRRELLASCVLPFALSCRDSAGVPTSPSPPSSARTIFRQDFNTAPLGGYGPDALSAGWMGATPNNGVSQGRTSVIEGAGAHEGRSLRVLYPKRGVGSSAGGALWRMSVGRFDDLYCSYYVRFEPDFDFVKGGKLPGLAGGAANTGGRKPSGTDGWSARMMWHARGEVVQYVYHVDQPTIYGEDFRWDHGGQRFFRPGTWHRVEHRIAINAPGERNGIVQGWFDGVLALDRRDVRFRDVDAFAIDVFAFSTFFGGDDPTWAPPKDEHITFDQFTITTARDNGSGSLPL
jgi:hypothetical protein